MVENFEGNNTINNQYFDVTFNREGNSFNYKLSFAAVEDPALCQTISDFARFNDDDFDDVSNDDGSDDNSDDDNNGTTTSSVKVFVSCETRSNRSKIDVKGNHVVTGSYQAVVQSGNNQVESGFKAAVGDEVEFDFDSEVGENSDVLVASDFIQNNSVSAEIKDQNGNSIGTDDAVCFSK
ncbi:MAG: hypothetical protein ACU84J_06140 [Gammaproteobacteria bacterium]